MDKFIDYLKNNIKGYKPVHNTIDIHGWMDSNINKVFDMTDVEFIIEVGTWKGKSAVEFAKNKKVKTILCIDTWLGAPEFWTTNGLLDNTRGISLKHNFGYPTVYFTFLDNIFNLELNNKIVPFPISSNQAADVLKHYNCVADAIYIDASHEQDEVYNDIVKFWPFIKNGGIMFGDDFNNCWPGVKHDVHKFCKNYNQSLVIHGKVWFVKKFIT